MYDIIKSVIYAGNYKLADIQYKIKKLYATGDLSDAQMDELMLLAAEGVSTDAERPEPLAMIRILSERIDALEARLNAMSDDAETEEPETGEDIVEHPAWEPWDGISNKYQPGDIVTHNGKVWESTYAGQNVWEPGATGIDERFWKEAE